MQALEVVERLVELARRRQPAAFLQQDLLEQLNAGDVPPGDLADLSRPVDQTDGQPARRKRVRHTAARQIERQHADHGVVVRRVEHDPVERPLRVQRLRRRGLRPGKPRGGQRTGDQEPPAATVV